MNRVISRVSALILTATMIGCGSGGNPLSDTDLKKIAGGDLKEVVPVSGKVNVDGQPALGVNIYLHAENDPNYISFARTGSDGKYCWATYRPCDGIPLGKYTLTFKHMPKMTPKGKGDDLLKGRYANPKKSEFKLTVEKGAPQKDVNYDLSSN